MGLYAVFIDVARAFDTVSCNGLENPGTPWLHHILHHPLPGLWRSTEAYWVTARQLPYLLRCQADGSLFNLWNWIIYVTVSQGGYRHDELGRMQQYYNLDKNLTNLAVLPFSAIVSIRQ